MQAATNQTDPNYQIVVEIRREINIKFRSEQKHNTTYKHIVHVILYNKNAY